MDKTAISTALAAGLAASALGAGVGAYTADTSSDKTTAEKLRHRLQNAGIGLAAGGLAGYGLSQLDSVKGLANSAKDYYEKFKSDYPTKEQSVINYGNNLRLPSDDWKRRLAEKIYKITPQSSDSDNQKAFRLGNLMAIDPFRMDPEDSDPKPSNAFAVGLGGSALGAGIGAIATDTSSDKTILQKIKHRLRNAGLGFAAGGLAGYGLTSGAESLGFIKNPRSVNPAATPSATTLTENKHKAPKETEKQVIGRLVKKELSGTLGVDATVTATDKQIEQATKTVNNRLLKSPQSPQELKDVEALRAAKENDNKEIEEVFKSVDPLNSRLAGAATGAGVAALGIKADPYPKPLVSKLDQLLKQLDPLRASVEKLPPSVPGVSPSTPVHETRTETHFDNPYAGKAIDHNSPRITKEGLRDWLIRNQSIDVPAFERITGNIVKPWGHIMNPKARADAEAKFLEKSNKLRDKLTTEMLKIPDPTLAVAAQPTEAAHLFGSTVDQLGTPVYSISREQALANIDTARAQLSTGAATPEEISKRLGIKPPPKTFGERAAGAGRAARVTGRLGTGAALGSLLPYVTELVNSIRNR